MALKNDPKFQATLKGLNKALSFAKKNPDHKDSVELRRRMESGQLNFELKALGKPPVPMKQSQVDLSKAFEVEQAPDVQSEIPEQGELSKLGTTLQETVQERGASQQRIKERREGGEISRRQELFQRVGQAVGGAAEVGFEAVLGLAELALPQAVEDKIKETVEFTGEGVVEYTKNFMEELRQSGNVDEQEIAGQIDEAVDLYKTDETFRDDVDAAGGFLEVLGIKPAKAVVTETVGAGVDVARKTAPIVKEGVEVVTEAGKEGAEAVAKVTQRAVTPSPEVVTQRIDDAVGRILQGKPGDIEAGRRALQEIDTKGVESYADLNVRINDNIEGLSKRVNTELDKYTDTYRSEDTLQQVRVGEEIVGNNPSVLALEGLENAYTKSGEIAKAARIKQLSEKFNTDGLTLRELNDLAREYGIEFKDRAFTKLGDPKPGFNAENFENVRTGLKNTVRDRIPSGDKLTLELDKQMSDLFSTRNLTTKMEEKVNNLFQKIKNRTLAQKVGGAAADVVDLVTFGTLRGFVSKLLPSNVGLKTANSLDLEKELTRNLKQIDKLNAIEDPDAFAKAFEEFIEELQPGLSIRSTVRPDAVAKKMDKADKDIIVKIIDNPDLRINNERLIEDMGLKNATDDELVSFLKEVVDEFEGVAERSVN